MPNIILNLFTLGAKSRSDIVLRRDNDDAIIKYNGHYYSAPWKRFSMENFTCPLELLY